MIFCNYPIELNWAAQ